MKNILIDDIDVFVFDFDGVLTDNHVYLGQEGMEFVSCSRADGLAFDVLHKLNKLVFILSTERNPVVTMRASKLKVRAIQGVSDKSIALKKLATDEGFLLDKALYVGNDLNDYNVMQICGYTACPYDSHHKVKEISLINLVARGGNGVARELVEDVLGVDFLKVLY